MEELNICEVEQVSGGMSVGEGIAAVGTVIAIGAVAPVIGTFAAAAGLAGMIGIAVIDVYSTLSQ